MPHPQKTIGIDCRFYSLNIGIGRYIAELISELGKLNSPHKYLLFFTKTGCAEFTQAKGKLPTKDSEIIIINAPHYSFAEQTTFLWALIKAKPDLMHFTNFNTPILYPFKSIATIHDLTLHFFPGNKLNKPWHRLAYHLAFKRTINHASRLITVSKHTASDLNRLYPQTKNKTTTIHLGVKSDFHKNDYPNISAKYSLPQQYLLYAGNWREHKNIPALIKAFAILKKEYTYKGSLVLTGKTRPHHQDIPELVTKLNLHDVIFVGDVDSQDLPSLFHYAEAFVFPTLYEGFGLPALEAMYTNTPVVASKCTCLPEVCGDAAQYFNPNSPEDMAKQINQVITTPSLKQELIKKGKQRVNQFSFATMAQLTHQIYNQLLT